MIAVGQDCFDYQVNKSAMCKNGLIWSSDLQMYVQNIDANRIHVSTFNWFYYGHHIKLMMHLSLLYLFF